LDLGAISLEQCQHALANHLLLPKQTKNKNKNK
jgi:hypothetical protein